MIHYWGAEAIQQRVGVKSLSGLRGLVAREHLPVFRRMKKLPGIRPRRVLYSNSLLITTWELGLARLEAERAQAMINRKNQNRRDARQRLRESPGQPAPGASLPSVVTPNQFLRQPNKHDPQT